MTRRIINTETAHLMKNLSASLLVVLVGCTYNVSPGPVYDVYVDPSYGSPIPGDWLVVVDRSTTEFQRTITPTGDICSASTVSLATGESITRSIKRTMLQVFEKVEFADSDAGSRQEGVAVVDLENFFADLECTLPDSGDEAASPCTSTVSLSLRLDAKNFGGESFFTSVDSRQSATSFACTGIEKATSNALGAALQDALQRLVEETMSAQSLRKNTQ